MAFTIRIEDKILWHKFKELFAVKQDKPVDYEEAEHAESKENVTSIKELENQMPEERPAKEESTSAELNRILRQILAPALRADGFTGSGRNFRKINSDWVTIISLESSRAGTGLAMNIGLHPLAFNDVLGKPVDAKKIKMQLCEFRTRLPSQNKASWWQFENDTPSMQCVMETIRDEYLYQCREQLKRLSGEQSPLIHAKVDHFAKGDYDFAPFQSADTRIALVIARLHQLQGRRTEAMAFAHHGLKHVGNSVGLRRDFEALLDESVLGAEATSADGVC